MTKADFRDPSTDVLSAIQAIVGPKGWKDPQDAPRYFEDPRGRFVGQGRMIVLPRTTQQVAQIVALCNANGIGIVPFSGGTGVVAGQLSIDSGQAVIVSLEKMNTIQKINVEDGVMVAQAGCILENVHRAALDHDMMFPLNMASKGSCCIGGNLATNAGGIGVLKYGNARDLCLGIEAVLPDGTILDELTPLKKNNTGYDLKHLLIGSEGTLGIITAASLRLVPVDPETATAILAIRSPADGLAVLETLRTHLGDSISALELISGFGLELVTSHFPNLRNPLVNPPNWVLLLEATGPIGTRDKITAALEHCSEKDLLQDAIIAQSDGQRQNLWDLRENIPEANRTAGAFCNSDTSVPVSRVDGFIRDTHLAIGAIHAGVRVNSYGHLGDGNIHHNVVPPAGISKAAFLSENPGIIDLVREAINEVTHAHGGSISAEHGIGRLKVEDLERYASAPRLNTLRRIKAAMDPNSIMNPGALIR